MTFFRVQHVPDSFADLTALAKGPPQVDVIITDPPYIGLDQDEAWVQKAHSRLMSLGVLKTRYTDEYALGLCKMWGKEPEES